MNLGESTSPTSKPGGSVEKPASTKGVWAGRVTTGLLVLFLVFDGTTKIVRVPAVLEACVKLGFGETATVAIGAILLASTLLYVIPRTAPLGAVLLTGYLRAPSAPTCAASRASSASRSPRRSASWAG